MQSKNSCDLENSSQLALTKLQLAIKGLYFKTFVRQLSTFSNKLCKYSGRQSHQQTEWFLRADRFTPDNTNSLLLEDKEVLARTAPFNPSKKVASFHNLCQRGSLKISSSSFSHPRRTVPRFSTSAQAPPAHEPVVPLKASQRQSEDESKEENQAINNFRLQKTRRQQYKNHMMQAERAEIFKWIDKSITGLLLNPSKLSRRRQEKIHQMDHFISMEVSARQPESNPSDRLKKVPQKMFKGNQPKTDRTAKSQSPAPLVLASDNYQELKHEQKIYLLNIPNELKLTHGVTLRENQKHSHNSENTNGATRKKLQFLKNEEINPVKIKMSELMSFKKITTSTNLAYCSSMKTVKELPKDGTESKISIDSKQFLEEPSGSRKLIKIANRRIYEQLLVDLHEEGTQLSLRKGRMKPRKEGKVRFDNASMS